MKTQYFDPMFYICSDDMPFTICSEVRLKDGEVNGEMLVGALRKAIRRYPYFSVKVVAEDEELKVVPNSLPIVVYREERIFPLGSDEVNRHLLAVSYKDNLIRLFVSHVITDGGGWLPFVKTLLYYYFCERLDTRLDSTGVNLAEDECLPDEIGNPYPEEKMKGALPLYECPKKEFFRLCDGGYVNDSKKTVYRFRVREDDMMKFSQDHDGSPCALVSSLMAKAIWELHPDEKKDLVSAVSFNLRPALGNAYSYRMLCNAIMLRYPERLRNADIGKICTCTRGMITVQSQPENVLAYADAMRRELEKFIKIPDLKTKKELMGKYALKDSVNNTFSVSYVGKKSFGSFEKYLDSMYNITDGSTYRSLFVEIISINGWFDIAFLQGFSSDAYYRSFLRQLEAHGLEYVEDKVTPFCTAGMILP